MNRRPTRWQRVVLPLNYTRINLAPRRGIEPLCTARQAVIIAIISTRQIGSSTWDRTRDNLINSQVLYHLSYRGIKSLSAQLSLRPCWIVSNKGVWWTLSRHSVFNVTPVTPHLQGLNFVVYLKFWWRWTGSNRRHHACKACALPTELHPQNLTILKHTAELHLPHRTVSCYFRFVITF